jgi:hypothetical protein
LKDGLSGHDDFMIALQRYVLLCSMYLWFESGGYGGDCADPCRKCVGGAKDELICRHLARW